MLSLCSTPPSRTLHLESRGSDCLSNGAPVRLRGGPPESFLGSSAILRHKYK